MTRHFAALFTLIVITAVLVGANLLGILQSVEAPVHAALTGALGAGKQVGYVAVKDTESLKAALEAIKAYPVDKQSGVFRGHYFVRIEGDPNSVRAATTAAAYQASLRQGLVFSGIQVE